MIRIDRFKNLIFPQLLTEVSHMKILLICLLSWQSCVIIIFVRRSIAILLMILMLQSNFCPSRGYLVRVAAVDQASLTAKAVTSIGSTRHFWHSSNCPSAEMVFGIKSQINKPSHTEQRLLSGSPTPGSRLNIQNNQFWDCVLCVQSRTSPTNQPSQSLSIHETSP